jgi:hypothetical protein
MIIAIQCWEHNGKGDQAQAAEWVKFITDIQDKPRKDILLAVVRRFDTPLSDAMREAAQYAKSKFTVDTSAQSVVKVRGWPDGPNEVWNYTMSYYARTAFQHGHKEIFTTEPDTVPLYRDWIRRLEAEHALTRAAGKLVTGCYHAPDYDGNPYKHINGNLIMDLAWYWERRQKLSHTPQGKAWDTTHANKIVPVARASSAWANPYRMTGITVEQVRKLRDAGVVWLHGVKDDSARTAAEMLVDEPATVEHPLPPGTDPQVTYKDNVPRLA